MPNKVLSGSLEILKKQIDSLNIVLKRIEFHTEMKYVRGYIKGFLE